MVDMHLKVDEYGKKMAHQLLEYQIFFRMVQLGLILRCYDDMENDENISLRNGDAITSQCQELQLEKYLF